MTPIKESNTISLRSIKTAFCIVLAFSFLLACTSSKDDQSLNCKKNFSGKWKYDNRTTSEIYVERTKNKQYEYTKGGKYYYEYDVKWLDKCRYQMTFVKTNSPVPYKSWEGDVLTVEILSTGPNKIQYKTVYENDSYSGYMTKIDP